MLVKVTGHTHVHYPVTLKTLHYKTDSCTEHTHTCKQLCTLAFWFSFSLSFTISSLAVTRSCDVCSCTGWHTESIGLVLLRADLVVKEEDEVCDKEVSGRRCVVESCCCCCCNTSCDLLTWRPETSCNFTAWKILHSYINTNYTLYENKCALILALYMYCTCMVHIHVLNKYCTCVHVIKNWTDEKEKH